MLRIDWDHRQSATQMEENISGEGLASIVEPVSTYTSIRACEDHGVAATIVCWFLKPPQEARLLDSVEDVRRWRRAQHARSTAANAAYNDNEP